MADTVTQRLPGAPAAPAGEPEVLRPLVLAGGGLVMVVVGLGLDALAHSRDAGLAAREGLLSVGNPAHALFLAGALLAGLGVLRAAWLWRGRALRPGTVLPAVLAALLAATVATAATWTLVGGHTHGAAGAAGAHDHGANLAPVGEATAAQVAAATDLLERSIAATVRYRDPAVAKRDGYYVDVAALQQGMARIVHAPRADAREDDHILDPARPESLIYARAPNGPIMLVGVLYVMPRGQLGAQVGGPITRWHLHLSCLDPVSGIRAPVPDAATACPAGQQARESREMMHVWFTDSLASAFARRAPAPDLLAWQQANARPALAP